MPANTQDLFECIYTLDSSSEAIKSFTISLDGQIVSTGITPPLKVWDFQKQQVIQTTEKDYYTDNYEFVVLSPDSPKLLICSYNTRYEPKLVIWDWHSEEKICSFEIDTFSLTYEWDHEHHYLPGKFSVAICPGGKAIVISYDYENEHGGHVRSVSQVVNWATGYTFRLNGNYDGICWTINRDAWTIVSTNDKTIKIWENNYNDLDVDEIKEKYGYGSLSRGEKVCTDEVMSDLDFSTVEVSRVIEEHSAIATCFAITEARNGEFLVIGTADSEIKVWDWDTEEIILTLQGHSAAVTCLNISENEKILVSGSDDNTVIVWDFENHQIIQTLQGHLSAIKSVAISSDNQTIFSQSKDNIIKIWKVK